MAGKRELILQELEQISNANEGLLRPETVVEFAKNPKTTLHSQFTWNDGEAAQQWRLQQARQVIRVMVTVAPIDNDGKIRAFVSLKDDRYNGFGYRPTISVLNDATMRKRLLAEAHEDAQVFISKYESLEEWAKTIDEMKKIVGKPAQPKRKYKRSQAIAVNA